MLVVYFSAHLITEAVLYAAQYLTSCWMLVPCHRCTSPADPCCQRHPLCIMRTVGPHFMQHVCGSHRAFVVSLQALDRARVLSALQRRLEADRDAALGEAAAQR